MELGLLVRNRISRTTYSRILDGKVNVEEAYRHLTSGHIKAGSRPYLNVPPRGEIILFFQENIF